MPLYEVTAYATAVIEAENRDQAEKQVIAWLDFGSYDSEDFELMVIERRPEKQEASS